MPSKVLSVAALSALFAGGSLYGQPQGLVLNEIVTGLIRPVGGDAPAGDLDRLFILSGRGDGEIRILDLETGVLMPQPFLTIPGLQVGSESGMLGLAFHPDYGSNGHFFVAYTAEGGSFGNGIKVIERYTVSSTNPNVADPASARAVLRTDWPHALHFGGWMDFGDDGYLYVSNGEGGGPWRASRLTEPHGKVLRIDVDGDDFPGDPDKNYAVPPTNPLVGVSGNDEVLIAGLRNPWRCSFDRATGDLWIADVGAAGWEEVNHWPSGTTELTHYGWDCFEGTHATASTGCTASPIPPIHEYDHVSSPFGCSVIGGYVYRGCSIPELQGMYLFTDYCAGSIWGMRYDGQTVTEFVDLTPQLNPGNMFGAFTSFAEDEQGELYLMSLAGGGRIWRIEDTGTGGACPCPADCDQSTGAGTLDIFDFLCFQDAFVTMDPRGDCDGNSVFDVFDFLCFQDAFAQGCP